MGALRCGLCLDCVCPEAAICRRAFATGPCHPSWYAIVVTIGANTNSPNCGVIAPEIFGKEYLLFNAGVNQWARAPHADGVSVSATAVQLSPNVSGLMSIEFTRGADFIRIEWPAPQIPGEDCVFGQDTRPILSSSCGITCPKFDMSGIASNRFYDISNPPLSVRLDASISGPGGGICTSSWSDVLPLQALGFIHDGYAAGASFRRGNPNEHFFNTVFADGVVFGSFYPDDWPTNPFCNVSSFLPTSICLRDKDALSPVWPVFNWPADFVAGCSTCVAPDSATVTITEL